MNYQTQHADRADLVQPAFNELDWIVTWEILEINDDFVSQCIMTHPTYGEARGISKVIAFASRDAVKKAKKLFWQHHKISGME